MTFNHIGYAVLCVVVPAAWGLVVYWVSRKIERRILPQNGDKSAEPQTLPVEYHI